MPHQPAEHPTLAPPLRVASPAQDPGITTLARQALQRGRPLLLRARPGRGDDVVEAPTSAPGTVPLQGLRCSARIRAVAYPAALPRRAYAGCGAERRPVVVAVDARGEIVVVDAVGQRPWVASPVGDLLADPGLRAFGRATPPPPAPMADWVVSAWLERVLDEILAADLGSRPPWAALSAGHPLAGGRTLEARELGHRTDDLPLGWEPLRRIAAAAALTGPLMSSTLAHWYDEGAFARHLFATVGEADELLPDVLALLSPADGSRVLVAMGERWSP